MKKIALEVAIVLLWLSYSSLAAADSGVTLRLDRDSASLLDTVRMEVNVSGSLSSSTQPVIHGLEDFSVTQKGTSSRVEIVNGKVNSGIAYTYYIQPKKIGTFQIGPAKIDANGRTYTSNSTKLVVTAPRQQSGPDSGPVFMEATISSRDIFVEEQALYTLKFYRRIIVRNLSLSLPEIENMVFKQLGQPLEYQTTTAGTTFQVLEVRYALLASKAGTHTIGPSKMRMTVRQRGRNSLFDDFFKNPSSNRSFSTFSSGRPLTVASGPVVLNVSPLPEKEKPADFSGLVGNFQMDSKLEPTALKAGDSATLTITVSGRGNANRIPDVHLPDMPFARTYGDQPVLDAGEDAHGIGGTKTMKWALVPEKAGRFDIPSQKLSFFDPGAGKYIVLETPVHTLDVLPGDTEEPPVLHASPGLGPVDNHPVKNEIQPIGKDILPIHTTAGDLSGHSGSLFTGWGFWLALIGPPWVYLMLMGFLKLSHRSPERSAQLRSRNAFGALKKRCRQVQPGSAGMIDAFKDYLNDRFGLSLGAMTADDAEQILRSRGVGPETAIQAGSLIRQFENAVYAGTALRQTDAAEELVALVKALEKEIP